VYGANRPGANRPGRGEASWGETARGRNVHKSINYIARRLSARSIVVCRPIAPLKSPSHRAGIDAVNCHHSDHTCLLLKLTVNFVQLLNGRQFAMLPEHILVHFHCRDKVIPFRSFRLPLPSL